jgi:malonyl-CoA O-methyltransferase
MNGVINFSVGYNGFMKKGLDAKSGFARYAAVYDNHEAYWDSFEQNYLAPFLAMSKGKKVLDAGAGTGRLSFKLKGAGAQVTAIDISPEMLAKLKQREGGVEVVEGDIQHMPFADGSFDMVFSSLTIVHLQKIEAFLDECYRVLKDGGIFALVNIHFRKPLILKDSHGKYTIQCYNHFPRHVREAAEALAFGVEDEIMVYEGDNVWISQILVLKK